MRNRDVIAAWVAGRPGQNGRGNLHTDGRDLYSYSLLIGYTGAGCENVVFRYTAPDAFYSTTTSRHVGLALRAADRVEHP